MRVLLDTQIVIWAVEDNALLLPLLKSILQDLTSELLVSQFSLMEIAIKLKIGKLPEFIVSLNDFVSQLQRDGITVLPITNTHLFHYHLIPLVEDHRDPFDRFLLATALAE